MCYDMEKSLSASLTVHWSRKRKRWESDHVFFWYDKKRLWSCQSDDGRYFYGFRSFRKLLKSYVGGTLCEKIGSHPMKKVKAKYWFSQSPRQVTCRVTTRYTVPVLDELFGEEE